MIYIFHVLLALFLFPHLVIGEDLMSTQSTPGTIIILNGPSASGKSSVQQELQKKFSSLYLKIGIDTFFDALIATPDLSNFEQTKEFSQYTNDNILIRRVRLTQDRDGYPIVPLEIGPAGDKIIFGMHSAIAAYANKGNNILVDYILYKPEWLTDLIEALKGHKVYLIGIKIPLNIIEEREKKRATSPVGHARSHYNHVHDRIVYDLVIEDATLTPEQIASKIKDFVERNPIPTALNTMLKS